MSREYKNRVTIELSEEDLKLATALAGMRDMDVKFFIEEFVEVMLADQRQRTQIDPRFVKNVTCSACGKKQYINLKAKVDGWRCCNCLSSLSLSVEIQDGTREGVEDRKTGPEGQHSGLSDRVH